jgi:uncharacterized protein (TIGR02246 family)
LRFRIATKIDRERNHHAADLAHRRLSHRRLWPAGTRRDAMSVFQETSKAWETAYNAGEAGSIAALYAEDATFISGALGSLKGRAAIEKAVADQMKKSPSITNTQIEAQMRGDVVWGHGDFAYANGPSGHYGLTMVKDTNGWLIIMQVGNVTSPK